MTVTLFKRHLSCVTDGQRERDRMMLNNSKNVFVTLCP